MTGTLEAPNSPFKTYISVLLTLLGRTVMVVVSLCGFAALGAAQSADPLRTQTMRPVIRGRVAAVPSMRRRRPRRRAGRVLHGGVELNSRRIGVNTNRAEKLNSRLRI